MKITTPTETKNIAELWGKFRALIARTFWRHHWKEVPGNGGGRCRICSICGAQQEWFAQFHDPKPGDYYWETWDEGDSSKHCIKFESKQK